MRRTFFVVAAVVAAVILVVSSARAQSPVEELIWQQMTSDEKPDTAQSVDQIVYPEDLGTWDSITGTTGVTLTSGTAWASNGWDTREADFCAIYMSWSADFSDSIRAVMRSGINMDASTHIAPNLDPGRRSSPADTVLAYLVDSGGTGGYAYVPLVDRTGRPIWTPFKSLEFLKIGTGNVSNFRCWLIRRRGR